MHDDLERKAQELTEANRQRRNRVSPWAVIVMLIAIPLIVAVRCWPALPS